VEYFHFSSSKTHSTFEDFQIGHHYLSNTLDLTQLCQNFKTESKSNPEFIWNQHLITPFEQVNLGHVYISLFQGIGHSKTF
jgi:hypothetical protein